MKLNIKMHAQCAKIKFIKLGAADSEIVKHVFVRKEAIKQIKTIVTQEQIKDLKLKHLYVASSWILQNG